jgi:hypothetical protein
VKGRTLARRQAGRSILFAVMIILLYVAADDMLYQRKKAASIGR